MGWQLPAVTAFFRVMVKGLHRRLPMVGPNNLLLAGAVWVHEPCGDEPRVVVV